PAQQLADAVAPGNGQVGVRFAYSGLHRLLLTPHPDAPEVHLDALVMTSGNLSDEPICTDPVEADQRLARLADAFLHHDRPIHA
ncbi:Sua5/YciO/YrdC/YwlC family protein, partial [Klebsiella pneumoniae]|nr:Sua5/YciO/YrdC/YwlC family protein [Klebsiella pneumoniae]